MFVKIDAINICFLGSPSGQLDHIKPFCFNFSLPIAIWTLVTKTGLRTGGTRTPKPLCELSLGDPLQQALHSLLPHLPTFFVPPSDRG